MGSPTIVSRGRRAVRAGGWRTRAAAVLLIGGVVAGGMAQPAHADVLHTVRLTGTVNLRDIDSPDSDDVCGFNINVVDQVQFETKPEGRLSTTPRCDEVRLKLNFTVTVNGSGTVRVKGSAKAEEEDCFLSCGWDDLGTFNMSTRTLPPNGDPVNWSGSFSGGDEGRGSWNLNFTHVQ